MDAIESGITKIPRLPAIDNTGRPDPKYFKLWEHITRDLKAGEKLTGGKPKPEVVYRKAEDALLTLAGEWKERFDQIQGAHPGQDRTPPVMIIVCDTEAWEQSAAFQLEKLAQAGVVYCYARNDRLEFNIPYELYGVPHVYEPDFIVRLTNGVTILLEVKGKSYDNTDVKHQAARRWKDAVNHWGRLGCWDFLPCRDPQKLAEELRKLIAAPEQRLAVGANTLIVNP